MEVRYFINGRRYCRTDWDKLLDLLRGSEIPYRIERVGDKVEIITRKPF